MPTIKDLLASIYNEEVAISVKREIDALKTKYDIPEASWTPSEKDVVLITYGDQVTTPGISKLESLRRFLDKHASGLFSTVHLLPFYPYSSDDGFSVIDYYEVNPDLGSWADIDAWSAKYGLMFDAVINHNSSQSTWFKKFVEGDDAFRGFYIEVEDPGPYASVVRPRTLPLFHQFGDKPLVWTTFSKDQVDLNYENPKVLLQIIDLLLFYVSQGARILRLDAIGFMWKAPNTSCIHLPETHQIIKLFRQVIHEVAPSVLLVTETNVPHAENISYFGAGDEAHMVYNFTLPPLLAFSLLHGEVSKLTSWAQTIEHPYNDTCFFNFLASHDGIGLRGVQDLLDDREISMMIEAAEANGGKISYRATEGTPQPYEINCNYLSLLGGVERDAHKAIKRMLLAHAVLLTMPGLPAIYFHSFFGSSNDLEGLEKSDHNRSINRQKFTTEELATQLQLKGSTQQTISEILGSYLRIRQDHAVLNPYSAYSFEHMGDAVFVIHRLTEQHELTAYFNFSDKPVEINTNKRSKNLLNDEHHGGLLKLMSFEFAWLLTEVSATK